MVSRRLTCAGTILVPHARLSRENGHECTGTKHMSLWLFYEHIVYIRKLRPQLDLKVHFRVIWWKSTFSYCDHLRQHFALIQWCFAWSSGVVKNDAWCAIKSTPCRTSKHTSAMYSFSLSASSISSFAVLDSCANQSHYKNKRQAGPFVTDLKCSRPHYHLKLCTFAA